MRLESEARKLSVQGSVTMNIDPYEMLGEVGTHPCDTPNCAFVSITFVFSHFSNRVFNHREDVSHPLRVSTRLCVSPSISNIFIVLSDEQVANLRP